MTKVDHLIDADMIGPPENIQIDLLLAHKLEDCYAALWVADTSNTLSPITIASEQLKTLFQITRKPVSKQATAVYYSLRLQGEKEELISAIQIQKDYITKMDFEIPRYHAELTLHTLGQIHLTPEQLKKRILSMYNDNFEALKQLKKYGVLKHEKTIEQTISEAWHKVPLYRSSRCNI